MVDLLSQLELDGIREDAEQLFSEATVTFTRDPIVESANVSADGTLSKTPITLFANLRCRYAPVLARRDRFDEVGLALVFTRQYRIKVPWDTTGLRVGDYAEITASNDPDVIDRNFVVRDVVMTEDNSLRIVTVQDSDE